MNIKNQYNPKVLRKIKNNTNSTQRNLSHQFGLILGKLKYFINSLIEKSFVKINNFKKNLNKKKYIFITTLKSFSTKSKLTLDFMKIKMNEYVELKKGIEN